MVSISPSLTGFCPITTFYHSRLTDNSRFQSGNDIRRAVILGMRALPNAFPMNCTTPHVPTKLSRRRLVPRAWTSFPVIVASLVLVAPVAAIGPDIIVGDIAGSNDIIRHGTVGNITSYSFRTTACNIGDREANWFSTTNQHPVITQSMYRLHEGWFQQIGTAWLKHGFATENAVLTGCGDCIPTDGQTLGVGCADTYTGLLNGVQALLGPPSQVNPSTGFFPYPFTAPAIQPIIGRRLQVRHRMIDPAFNEGARYFIEAQYVAADDAFFGNSDNNASWRRVNVTSGGSGFLLSTAGPTMRMEPAIFAWKASDPQVKLSQVVIENDGGPGYRGYLWVGARATYAGNCMWIYDYAVQNLNSHQACGRFVVHHPPAAVITGGESVHPRHHSGENYLPFSWMQSVLPDQYVFETYTFQQAPWANAIWWGTLHNFRVYAQAPPDCSGMVELRLHRSPDRPSIFVQTITPGLGDPCPMLDEFGEPILPSCDQAMARSRSRLTSPTSQDQMQPDSDRKMPGAIQGDPDRIKN